MIRLRTSQNGSLLIPLVLFIMLFLGAAGFGVWAYMQRQDYKYNTDKKVAEAVEIAVEKSKKQQEQEFIQREKKPLRAYQGPQSLGSITFKYPKTWSVYADELQESELTVAAHPGMVPADNGADQQAYALSVKVENVTYDQKVAEYDSFVETGAAKARPYKMPKQPKIVGMRIDGSLSDQHKGSAIILPLRDKTIIISTLSDQFIDDFDKIIIPNFNFLP